MTSDCISFSKIPHTSRLFHDYLFQFQRVSTFYSRPPSADWTLNEQTKLHVPDERRRRVADVLERQNRTWGAGEPTLSAIDRLRRGASAFVTGQQVGLFGGPLYSLLKAASVLNFAREMSRSGKPAVAIFWLATEDHDVAEVSSALMPSGARELRDFAYAVRSNGAAPVGNVQFGPEIDALSAEASSLLEPSEAARFVRESYRTGETFGSAFAKLFTHIFRDIGLILLDPLDAELHAIAAPMLQQAAERAEELDEALLARGKQLRNAGYHEQVKVTPASTLLFALQDGERVVMHRGNDGDFLVGKRKFARAEMLARIAEHPEQFSPNVLLRPVMQDYLLPTVAYFGGPAEIAYFAQAAVVYEKLLGRVTPVLPRMSATLVSARMQKLLNRYQLTLPDLFHGGEHLRELLGSRVLPSDLQQNLDATSAAVQDNMSRLQQSLKGLDPTLVEAAERSTRKMQYQVGKLRSKAARAELRRNEMLTRDAEEILTSLFPRKTLQEREIAGIYFLATHGSELLQNLVEVTARQCPGHQVIHV
ncbi:MAG TPA: bacillithiol biosynthesis cysteine-adding enzyme BshC [Clostridia bacterium]|nr:bacillithiol biosynthesis cysteine-adding enzyme BshC [Clostridia bacterium]